MAIFMNTGPAAVMYPLGAVDVDIDITNDTAMTDIHPTARPATATTNTNTATQSSCEQQPPAHLQISRAANTTCRRLSSTDDRPIFTNPSHKRSRDDEDDEFATTPIHPRSSSSSLSRGGNIMHDDGQNANTAFPSLVNEHNDPIIPRCKKVEVDHDIHHHLNTHHNHDRHHHHPATTTEPLITHQGWPIESPHFTEERITYALGIGWRYLPVRPGDIGGDIDFIAATRGWEKFIENHYRCEIGRARIFLERKDEGMYLVAATPPVARSAAERGRRQREMVERYHRSRDGGGIDAGRDGVGLFEAVEDGDDAVGYYLLSNDLLRARLVGESWGQCVENLNKRPIAFPEGSVELVAQSSGSQNDKGGGDEMDIDASN